MSEAQGYARLTIERMDGSRETLKTRESVTDIKRRIRLLLLELAEAQADLSRAEAAEEEADRG